MMFIGGVVVTHGFWKSAREVEKQNKSCIIVQLIMSLHRETNNNNIWQLF